DKGDYWIFDNGKSKTSLGSRASAGLSFVNYSLEGVRYETMRPGAWNLEDRCRDMDADGIFAQVLYPGMGQTAMMAYADDRTMHMAVVRAYNEWVAELAASSGGRLIPLPMLPVTGVDDAIEELRWSNDRGHIGGIIARMPNGGFDPLPEDDRFWA